MLLSHWVLDANFEAFVTNRSQETRVHLMPDYVIREVL